MSARRRFVVDTTVFISAALLRGSTPAQAVRKALSLGDVLLSPETLHELHATLARSKFDAYVPRSERESFIDALVDRAAFIEPTATISACRDPKDDKFLELAVSGQAEVIVTGDLDLLVLHPFRGISILSPADFLAGAPSAPP